eukprot:gene28532-35406_t
MDSQRPGSRGYVPCNDEGVPELWENEELSFQLTNYIEETGDDDEEEEDSEVFLIPAVEEDIMKLFDALSHAALLNPDPDEEDDEGDFIYDGEEVALGAEQARILDHLESVFTFPEDEDNGEGGGEGGVDGQYDDVEGDGDGGDVI